MKNDQTGLRVRVQASPGHSVEFSMGTLEEMIRHRMAGKPYTVIGYIYNLPAPTVKRAIREAIQRLPL